MSAIGEWIWQKAIVKGVSIAVRAGVAWFMATTIDDKFGISINPEALTLGILGLMEVGRNFLKMKFPKIFGWL